MTAAAFPPVDPTLRAAGHFDCFSILMLFRRLWVCAQTHEYPASATMNMLYLLCDRAFYGNLTQGAYPDYSCPWPEIPAHCANYSHCNNSNERASLDDARSWALKLCLEAKCMHKALKNRTFLYLRAHILAQWNQLSIMRPNATITDLIGWPIQEFSDATEARPFFRP